MTRPYFVPLPSYNECRYYAYIIQPLNFWPDFLSYGRKAGLAYFIVTTCVRERPCSHYQISNH